MQDRPDEPKSIRRRMQDMMQSRHALWGVFLASLGETTVIPIPIEIVLIPVMLTNRNRLWLISAMTLLGCLVGSIIGYLIGFGAFNAVGEPLLNALGLAETFREHQPEVMENGFYYVLTIALTPIPFQIAYLGAGLVKMPFLTFIAAVAIGRGVRYFGLAVLVLGLGRAAGPWLERNQYRIAIGATLIFIGGYLAYEFIAG